MYHVSFLEKIFIYLGFAGFIIGPIAWIVFIVSCFRTKYAYSDSIRKRRCILRTVSLILAILFTIIAILFLYFMSKGEGGAPLPTNYS